MKGESYHRMGSLLPDNSQNTSGHAFARTNQPKFLQLYLIDTEDVENRIHTKALDSVRGRRVLQSLVDKLKNAPDGFYARIIPNMERMKNAPDPGYKLVLRGASKPTQNHTGAFNMPTVSHIAALVPHVPDGNEAQQNQQNASVI